MVPPRNKEFTLSDALNRLGSTLVETAYLPNLNRYDPHPKQLKFHNCDKVGRLYIGGNRAGKTIANVMECLWWLTKTHPYRTLPKEPVRGRLVCVSFADGLDKIILPLFKQWLPPKYLIDGDWEKSYDNYHRTLTLSNGSYIEFMSYDQDLNKFAGTSRHFIAFDEEPPKAIFNECRARLVDTAGSWWISMTPVDGMTWVYDDIYSVAVDNSAHRYLVVQADMLDNPHITKEAAEEFLSGLDEKERAAREKGTFVQLGGRVFKSFSPDVHRVDYDFKVTPDMRVYTSIDIGWAHPTAWLWHAVEPNGHITTFHEMVESFVTIEEWAKRVREFEVRNKLNIFMRTGDPALMQTRSNTGTSDITEYGRHGIYIAVEGVPRAVDIGLVKIEQYLKADDDPREKGRPFWQYTSNCVTLETQMLRLRWSTYASKKLEYENAPKGTIHKKDDDAPDSLRYFMTLQPDLKFDDSRPIGRIVDKLGSVPDRPMPLLAKMDYNEPESVWELYEEAPIWDMEGLG